MDLVELSKENVGVSCMSICILLEKMIREDKIKAYAAPKGKTFFKKLTPVTRIDEHRPVLIEDINTGNRYLVKMHSEGGPFYNDGDSQTIYYQTILEKLSPGFVPSRKEMPWYRSRFSVPEDKIVARLEVNKSDDWEGSGETDYIKDSHRNTVVLGQKDALFDAILEYARKKE